MSRKSHLSTARIALAALALAACGAASADDSSMNPFTGDSYAYFNGDNLGNINVARAARRPGPDAAAERFKTDPQTERRIMLAGIEVRVTPPAMFTDKGA
jgi:hypothetical protein